MGSKIVPQRAGFQGSKHAVPDSEPSKFRCALKSRGQWDAFPAALIRRGANSERHGFKIASVENQRCTGSQVRHWHTRRACKIYHCVCRRSSTQSEMSSVSALTSRSIEIRRRARLRVAMLNKDSAAGTKDQTTPSKRWIFTGRLPQARNGRGHISAAVAKNCN